MAFDNPDSIPHYFTLADANGETIWHGRDGGSGSIELRLGHIPFGVYSWKLTTEHGQVAAGELQLQ